MALSRRSTIILQFTLIICISAIIAGLAGGLTSKVSKWSAEVEGKEEAVVNVTMRMEENYKRAWRDERMQMEQGREHEGGFEGVGHERCRRRERRRVVGGRRFEL